MKTDIATLRDEVYSVVEAIPMGKVVTYGCPACGQTSPRSTGGAHNGRSTSYTPVALPQSGEQPWVHSSELARTTWDA